MTIENIEYRNLDEIVFENRNKSYGAYLLRKTYNQHVNAAIIITGGLCALLIGIPTVTKWLGKDIPPIVAGETPRKPKETILERFEVQIPPKQVAVLPAQAANLVPEVTKEVVIDLPTPAVEQVSPVLAGSNEGTLGEPSIGTETGEGPPLVVASAPPIEKVEVLDFAEEMPEFPGGNAQLIKFLSKKLHYPSIAQQNETEGKVFVQFVVNRDGKITDVTILKGVSKECDEEATRVVQSMPNWKPGKQNGRAVSVKYVFPIVFKMG